jgi:tetrahydromethanopterin S-methyltransferase subunit G
VTDVYDELAEIHDLLTEISTRVERHGNIHVRLDHLEERIETLEQIMHADRQ